MFTAVEPFERWRGALDLDWRLVILLGWRGFSTSIITRDCDPFPWMLWVAAVDFLGSWGKTVPFTTNRSFHAVSVGRIPPSKLVKQPRRCGRGEARFRDTGEHEAAEPA